MKNRTLDFSRLVSALFFFAELLFISTLVLSIGAGTLWALEYPAPAPPGKATGSAGDRSFVLANRVLRCEWVVETGRLAAMIVTSEHTEQALRLDADWMPRVVLEDGRIIRPETLTPSRPPHLEGTTLAASFKDDASGLDIRWSAELKDEANGLIQTLELTATRDLGIKELLFVDAAVEGAKQVGQVDGSVVVVGDIFLAVEHPLAKNTVGKNNQVRCALPRGNVLKAEQTWRYSSVIGVTPAGQSRRGFLYYLEQRRAHPYRPFLHYNSWYHLNIGRPNSHMTETECLETIEHLGRELITQRGVKLDAFVWDDGWDDFNSLWGFHKDFPNGFERLKDAGKKYGAAQGVWMSPWGGYGEPKQKRLAYSVSQGYEANHNGFSMAGPKYGAAFRDACRTMIREHGVVFFKFDGMGAGGGSGATGGLADDVDAVLRLTRDLRKENRNLYISATVGTWASPFWTLYADSVWRQGGDTGFHGAGNGRQQWITYRDMFCYRRIVQWGPLYPLNALMLHGPCIGERENPAKMSRDESSVAEEFWSFFGSGTSLQELYISPHLLTPTMWDELAAAATWSRTHADVLVDTHWIGGDPGAGEVYGWASWQPRKGIVVLRNPSDQPGTYALELARDLELPDRHLTDYQLTSPRPGHPIDPLRASAVEQIRIELRPFEVRVFEATALPGTGTHHAATEQARTPSETASPTEAFASPEQTQMFVAQNPRSYWVFGEDRNRPIQRRDALPLHWVNGGEDLLDRFEGRTQPGEFYVFQLGLYSARKDIGPVHLRFENLSGKNGKIAAERMRCFNLGGTNYLGRPFTKDLVVAKGRLQALWIGVDVPADAKGTYVGSIIVAPESVKATTVRLTLDVEGEPVENHGDRKPGRLGRLRWLDSTIGLDDNHVVAPFEPIHREGQTLTILGRQVELGDNGLPARIRSYFSAGNTAIVKTPTEILAKPLEFVVETDAGPTKFIPTKLVFTDEQNGLVQWRSNSRAAGLELTVEGMMEFDGAISLKCVLTSERQVTVRTFRLETALTPEASTYFMGLGYKGGRRPESVDWKWSRLCQDAFWMGAVNAGLKLQFKGENYRTPLVNAYYDYHPIHIPESWSNGGKGGIRIRGEAGSAAVIGAYSGPRTLTRGQRLVFQIDGMISPFKLINTDAHWKNRYFQQYKNTTQYTRNPSLVSGMGANVLNIHHSNEPLPVINYPYWERSFPLLKQCVELAHQRDVLVKIYYTTREITNQLPELWAFNSLNGEIIFPGPGRNARPVTNPNGPHPWLIEHLREDFIPAWHDVLGGRYQDMLDLSVITTPDSRLDNFYLEGLDYTIRHADIDGLYVDDTALGRKSFQRARRIFESHKKQFLFDFHAWNGIMQRDEWGRINPMLRYCDILPYFDRIWMGEAYSYNDSPPDYWLTEISGIPFGVMGEMLQDGGNPWLGMVFGMTQRLGWSGDPGNIWKVWDDFGMQGSQMFGYWDPDSPVKTNSRQVLATAYVNQGKTLIALGNWGDGETRVRLQLDWPALGLDPTKATLFAPAVDEFQPSAVMRPSDSISVSPKHGLLIIVDETPREELKAPVGARVEANNP